MPWFKILGIDMPSASLTLFGMEYEPAFLERWHPDRPLNQPMLARSDVLARYAAVLKRSDFRAKSPFRDLREVQLSLDDAQRERMLAVCVTAGYEVEKSSDSWKVFGPQFQFLLRSSSESGGVTAIELELREPIERGPLHLGHATITFRGKLATIQLK